MHTKLQQTLNSLEDVRGQVAQMTRLPRLLEELSNALRGAVEYVLDVERAEQLATQAALQLNRDREHMEIRAKELRRQELNIAARVEQLERQERELKATRRGP